MNKAIIPPDRVAEVIEHPTEWLQGRALRRLGQGTCMNKQCRPGHDEILEEIGRGGLRVKA
jgi:hypothetical protein